jgi:tetratricopeptide (TPR) repeat protein
MQHRNGDLTDALESFTSVLRAIGDDRLVYESRGLVYQEMKNSERAIEDFNIAIRLDEEYAETYYYRGLSRIELKDFQEAIKDFHTALEKNSTNPG